MPVKIDVLATSISTPFIPNKKAPGGQVCLPTGGAAQLADNPAHTPGLAMSEPPLTFLYFVVDLQQPFDEPAIAKQNVYFILAYHGATDPFYG